MNIYIYYRHAASAGPGRNRPSWFSYEACFKNLLSTIEGHSNINLTVAMDGEDPTNFIHKYKDKYSLLQINKNSSLESWRVLWVDKITTLYSSFSGLDYVSLYDHNDKYFLPMYDELVSKILTTADHHWRTTPSTCGTYIISRDIFDKDYDVQSTYVGDHETFLWLNENRHRAVITPIPGLSTHCMEGLLSPTINWKDIC